MLLGHKTREVMLHWRGFWDGTVRKGVVPAVVTLYLSKSLSHLCVVTFHRGNYCLNPPQAHGPQSSLQSRWKKNTEYQRREKQLARYRHQL